MSNYNRTIVPVKKLQFPTWKTDTFENVKVCSCADMPHHEGHIRTLVIMSVIEYISTFSELRMHITRCYRLTNIIIEAYLHVHYDYVFIKIFMTTNAQLYNILGGCPFNGPLSGTKYPTRAASPIQNASTPKSSLPFSKHRSCALLCTVVRRF